MLMISDYFTKYANPRTCSDTMKKIVELVNEEKPCGDDGDCYKAVGKKAFDGPRNRIREKKTDTKKNEKWTGLTKEV
jgi:hypothetical protein